MSAKRPRPAIPVLVHVDNPTEVGSVTVDVSTIEGKMDTVITNQNRIYDKIPTSGGGGGGSTDMTTVNEKITSLSQTIGSSDSSSSDKDLLGRVKNLVASVGDFYGGTALNGVNIRSFLYNLREGIGDSSSAPTTTETTVRGLLTAIKTATGTLSSSSKDTDLIGCARNLRVAVGASGQQLLPTGDSIRSFLFNLCKAVGNSYDTPTATEDTIRGLLTAIKENTASGGGGGGGGSADLTTVNEKTTALATAIGSASDDSSTVSVIGLLKSITDKY